ncbi:sensor histidine kinase [Glaciihabitans sp. dw_435]|uniref:sensor histidine kinase n=1 Tax=Glaciihabitans sp. dw_435 TaxID=2720081 RepID=UPI001BD37ED6|nr:histidine kinase [Glaciihabitans sp. dw_435]
MFRFLRPYQLAVDIVIAGLFLASSFALSGGRGAEYLLAAALTIALLLRRIAPAWSLSVSWVAALGQMYVVNLTPTFTDFAILAVLYTSAAYGGRVVKWAGLVSVGVGSLLGSMYLVLSGNGDIFGLNFGSGDLSLDAQRIVQFFFLFIAMLVLLGLPWTVGLLVRTRVVARENKEAEIEASRQAEIAEQGVIVEQERNRIARDMHDVVAHSLAVVIAQADGARYARASDPAAVDGALTAISSTARDALADVRLLLGQLRHSQAEGPQPGLAELDRLLDQLRASGLLIRDETVGPPLQLGTGQQLAIYRIVQEALTNVLRHGNVLKEVTVLFNWTATDLEVTIDSALTASPHTGELRLGHGLAGMRERATLAGGWLTALPRDNRFVVMASVPTAAAVRS